MIKLPKKLTISWLRQRYLSGMLKPADVVEACCARMEEFNDYNVWIYKLNKDELAVYLNRLNQMAPQQYPLWGIPFAIKDNIDIKGIPTTAACHEFEYIPEVDSLVVERVIESGAIPLGKTNLDQFATGLVGTRSPYGEVHNSLRPELISGGSSAGSAVAVALGQAAFAFGTDTAGSGRVPAALNGLIGYKPSIGAWPTRGVVPACASLDCVNTFTNTIDDALAIDSSARGFCKTDKWSKDIQSPVPVRPAKILIPQLTEEDFFGIFSSEYFEAWKKTVALLYTLGIKIEIIDSSIFQNAAEILYGGPWIAERWADLGTFITEHADDIFPVTLEILQSGSGDKYNAYELFSAIHKLQEYCMRTREILDGAVYITPTCGGTWTREQVRADPLTTNTAMGYFTNHCNLLDLSAVAIPSALAAESLPFGITVFGLSDQERFILGMACIWERLYKKAVATTINLAVCGLHMRGMALEYQLKECGAKFLREDRTAPYYRMVCLETKPEKPGLIRKNTGGTSLAVEIWEMNDNSFGAFAANISSPLCFGNILMMDGTETLGFLCEEFVEKASKDITDFGGFKAYLDYNKQKI